MKFNKTIIPFALVGYEIGYTNLPLCASLAVYIPLTNRIRGLYCKLRTEFFPVNLWPKLGSLEWNLIKCKKKISFIYTTTVVTELA